MNNTKTYSVGDEFAVNWSNGAGYDVFRVCLTDFGQPVFKLIESYEVCADGSYVKVSV